MLYSKNVIYYLMFRAAVTRKVSHAFKRKRKKTSSTVSFLIQFFVSFGQIYKNTRNVITSLKTFKRHYNILYCFLAVLVKSERNTKTLNEVMTDSEEFLN